MTFFDETKSIIENLYLLSGPLLLFMSLIAVKQLKVAKDNIKINSQRQASTMSFELCEKYEKPIKEKHTQLSHKMKELGIDAEKIFALNPSELRNLPKRITENIEFKKIMENRDELSSLTISLINELEGFSSPFIRKLADEELAYDLQIDQFYAWATLCIAELHYFQNKEEGLIKMDFGGNVCDLFQIWKSRNEKEDIERQVSQLNIRKNKIITKKIIPIGTE